MSTLSHDDKTPEQPADGDKVFLRDISDTGTGINDGIIVATVDLLGQTIIAGRGAEIKTQYEAQADTNAFTDAEQTKLAGIETGATADQTGAEIKTAYEAEANTNAFTDADHAKLDGIAAGAEVNPDVVPQAEAEAGTATTERTWTALRVAQAIAALGGGGGGGTWGSITGTLSSQTDLQAALDAKLALAGGTMTGDLNMGANNIITSGNVDGVDVSALVSLTEANLRTLIDALTDAQPATADRLVYVDADGTLQKCSAEDVVTQGNADIGIVPHKRISTTVDPTTTDDTNAGYAVNDIWTNTTDKTSWICVDATASAAVWKPTTLTVDGAGTPTVTATVPDFIGQIYIDTSAEDVYIAIDTAASSDFVQVDTAGGGGGNAWSDPVNADIVPDADGTRDLGADATRFAQAYVDEVHTTGGILQTEAADHTNTPAAGKGEWWTKNTAPNKPMFTDDDGVDHDLLVGEWHAVSGDGPTTSTANEQLWFVVPYDCTLKEILWASHRSQGADGTNYWTLMPKRRNSVADVDLLDAAFSTSGGINEDTSYDLGTITTNGTDMELSKGDVLMVTFTAVGSPPSLFGGRQGYSIHLEPR